MKISKVQREVLQHMANGSKLYSAMAVRSTSSHNWLSGELCFSLHTNTLKALLARGLIERANTKSTPYWRRDYAITQAGREAI